MRVSVLGSCVSRDIFRVAPTDGVVMGRYVARTSFATMFTAPLVPPYDPPADEKWEDRMARLETSKGSLDYLFSQPFDYLVIDLIDERHPVLADGEASALWTAPFRKAGLFKYKKPTWKKLSVGGERQMSMWREGLRRFTAIARQRGIQDRIVLNCVYLTRDFAQGGQFSRVKDWEMALNGTLRVMYDEFMDALPEAFQITYPEEIIKLPKRHAWGLAPYHYHDPLYVHARDQLLAIMGLGITSKQQHVCTSYQLPSTATSESAMVNPMIVGYSEFEATKTTVLKASPADSSVLPNDQKLSIAPGVLLRGRVTSERGTLCRVEDVTVNGAAVPTHLRYFYKPHWRSVPTSA